MGKLPLIALLWSKNNLISLNATDVASGWVETEALRNRAQVWTFQALERIKQRLPFPLLGIDSDEESPSPKLPGTERRQIKERDR